MPLKKRQFSTIKRLRGTAVRIHQHTHTNISKIQPPLSVRVVLSMPGTYIRTNIATAGALTLYSLEVLLQALPHCNHRHNKSCCSHYIRTVGSLRRVTWISWARATSAWALGSDDFSVSNQIKPNPPIHSNIAADTLRAPGRGGGQSPGVTDFLAQSLGAAYHTITNERIYSMERPLAQERSAPPPPSVFITNRSQVPTYLVFVLL